MKNLLIVICLFAVIFSGCATARPMVTHKEAIKNAAAQTSALVERFCVLKNTSGAAEYVSNIQDGINWAMECEQKINSATEEEKQKLLLFKTNTDRWMQEIKADSQDKDRLIRWTADNFQSFLSGVKKPAE